MGISSSVENKGKKVHLFKELWKLQTFCIHSFFSLELELLHTAVIGWNGFQDDKKWRIKAIPRMIKAGMD